MSQLNQPDGNWQVDSTSVARKVLKKNLFKKFSRTSVKPTRGEKGSGLGLHIVRELVALHNGMITVDSQPGQGTVFRIQLRLP